MTSSRFRDKPTQQILPISDAYCYCHFIKHFARVDITFFLYNFSVKEFLKSAP